MTEKEPLQKSYGEQLRSFLIESNAIEGVYDQDSLDQANYAWEYLISQNNLKPSVIFETHRVLMEHQRINLEHKGYWRDCNVRIGPFGAPDWTLIPQLMQAWIEEVNTSATFHLSEEEQDLLLQDFHVRYEKIHPFVDGNGRTGRMFWNFLRLKRGLPLKIIREEDRQEYYRLFRN